MWLEISRVEHQTHIVSFQSSTPLSEDPKGWKGKTLERGTESLPQNGKKELSYVRCFEAEMDRQSGQLFLNSRKVEGKRLSTVWD